jgi:hypothetical protein
MCVDLPNYGWVPQGTKVSLHDCNWGPQENDNQAWFVDCQFATGDDHLAYRIVNVKNGMCLDVPGVATGAVDVQLEVFPCRSNDDHEWIWLPNN